MLRHRQLHIALLAIAAAAAALFMLNDLPWGTARNMGPALVPGAIAIGLLLAGLWHALRTTVWPSDRRRARQGYAWIDLLPWAVPVAIVAVGLWLRDAPPDVLLRAGPAEYAAFYTLLLVIMLAACWLAERGALSRPAIALLLGALVGLGGIDVSTGVTRLWDDDPGFVHGALAGALVVGLRLPVAGFVVAYGLALQFEGQIRRSMLLSAGDALIFVTRPWSATLLAIAAAILIAVLVGRFGRRRWR